MAKRPSRCTTSALPSYVSHSVPPPSSPSLEYFLLTRAHRAGMTVYACSQPTDRTGWIRTHARTYAIVHASRHVHKRARKCNVTDFLTALSADGISTFNISMSVETRSCLSPYLTDLPIASCFSPSLSLSPVGLWYRHDATTVRSRAFRLCAAVSFSRRGEGCRG